MPEDTRKNLHKGKTEAKEQRKKRQGRHNASVEKNAEKLPEKKIEKTTAEVKEPEKPAYEPPGPEFYNSLKRETDEILKITEEANSKYKKKEIQSNWAKYEMPIETYDEIDEQESLGADYETLIQASFSVGGHFQFKHEKSWDITTGPTPYDKYFDINMESLSAALSTIPFYERNNIDKAIFSPSDIQSMEHRATKFKQKYYNDKKYVTPDSKAQDKILSSLMKSDIDTNRRYENKNNSEEIKFDDCTQSSDSDKEAPMKSDDKDVTDNNEIEKEKSIDIKNETAENMNTTNSTNETEDDRVEDATPNKILDNDFDDLVQNINNSKDSEIIPETTQQINNVPEKIELPKAPKELPVILSKEAPKNPIIESPEDLEKWLDDFLDG